MTKRLREQRPGANSACRAAPCLGIALIVAFLAVSLAPCPPPVGARVAHAERAPEVGMRTAASSLTAPCPCQCGEHAPIAGASAHLGAALPSTAPGLAPRLVAKFARFAPVRAAASFASPIDHIPLPV